jgi:hypothetical protein
MSSKLERKNPRPPSKERSIARPVTARISHDVFQLYGNSLITNQHSDALRCHANGLPLQINSCRKIASTWQRVLYHHPKRAMNLITLVYACSKAVLDTPKPQGCVLRTKPLEKLKLPTQCCSWSGTFPTSLIRDRISGRRHRFSTTTKPKKHQGFTNHTSTLHAVRRTTSSVSHSDR